MEKRTLENDTSKKGTTLDTNRFKANTHKREVQLHKYICSQSLQGKEQCWNTINEALNEIRTGKIILGGDLNLVRSVEEKFGGIYHIDPSRDALETIMEQHNLIDIPPNNGKYT